MLSFLLYKIGELIVVIFPWKIAYKVGVFFANLQFLISKKDRQAVINNLKFILPNESELEIRKKAREVFINFALYLVEFFRYSKVDKDFILKNISIEGIEIISDVLKQGRGGILITAHIGNWELAGMTLAILGYPVMAIALDHKNPEVNEFFRKRRVAKGLEVVSLGIAVKQCYKALKVNKLIAILGDRDFSNSGHRLEFLSKTKNIPRGPAVLALRTGAPIIPVFLFRKGLNNFEIHCLKPIEVLSQDNEMEIMQKYTKVIEEQIYKYPGQWLMFREFWKE